MSATCESPEFVLVLCRLRRRAAQRLACHRPDPAAALVILLSPAGVAAWDADPALPRLRAEAEAAERALAELLSARGEPAQADGREAYLGCDGEVLERSADPPSPSPPPSTVVPSTFVPRKPR